jgi:hypothetical protein
MEPTNPAEWPKHLDLPEPSPVEEFFACPIGVNLWNEYRQRRPEAPAVPPECAEELTDPDTALFWLHVSACLDCNEV